MKIFDRLKRLENYKRSRVMVTVLYSDGEKKEMRFAQAAYALIMGQAAHSDAKPYAVDVVDDESEHGQFLRSLAVSVDASDREAMLFEEFQT